MPKRKRECEEERLERKLRKYRDLLENTKRRRRRSRTRTRTPSPLPATPDCDPVDLVEDLTQSPIQDVEDSNVGESRDKEEEPLDDDILNILGDAPQDTNFGPSIHKELATRWADIIKNGITKEKRIELKEKYKTPENCKTLGAPKLNLEAQAAITEMAVKRDRAIAAKQDQVGRALSALATVFGKLCKNKENAPVINVVVDAARLLCDHQHQETTTRKNFILQGLEQTTREAIKDTETDTWLFGEGFAEKLKASKAIKKSAQEISGNKGVKGPTNPKQQKNLNFKGPVSHQSRGRVYQPGPQRFYQSYKKPTPVAQSAFLKGQPNKTPMRMNNRN